MKKPIFLVCLYLASCLGQLTFDNKFVSRPGEVTITPKPNGQFLTISTEKGFSWVISDQTVSMKTYATLVCVSSGSTTGMGIAQRDETDNKASYTRGSQMMPIVGASTAGTNDLFAFYSPTRPTRGKASNWGISPQIYDVNHDIVMMSVTWGGTWTASLKSQSTAATPWVTSTGYYGVGFELLNCGKAVWCLQDATQYAANAGYCDPGNAEPTCPAPTTCANPLNKVDCSSAADFHIHDYSCLSQCYSDTGNTAVIAGVEACATCTGNCQTCSGNLATCDTCLDGYNFYQSKCYSSCPAGTVKSVGAMTCEECTSPCAECSETKTTCSACVADHYLYKETCVTKCPAGYEEDKSNRKCQKPTVESQGIAGWKLGLIIALPTAFIVVGAAVFIYIKFLGKASANYLGKNAGKTNQTSNLSEDKSNNTITINDKSNNTINNNSNQSMIYVPTES